jgi:hypothetical protein
MALSENSLIKDINLTGNKISMEYYQEIITRIEERGSHVSISRGVEGYGGSECIVTSSGCATTTTSSSSSSSSSSSQSQSAQSRAASSYAAARQEKEEAYASRALVESSAVAESRVAAAEKVSSTYERTRSPHRVTSPYYSRAFIDKIYVTKMERSPLRRPDYSYLFEEAKAGSTTSQLYGGHYGYTGGQTTTGYTGSTTGYSRGTAATTTTTTTSTISQETVNKQVILN